MADKVVLISDDENFFDYFKSKLSLRKNDELYCFKFDDIPAKMHLIVHSVLIVNSENSQDKTLELLSFFRETPIIVSAYNTDEEYKVKCYQAGMFDFITPLISDKELQARILPALSVAGILKKSQRYREVLVKNNIISSNNEVYVDYGYVLDKELEQLANSSRKSCFLAISPDDKTKFLLQANQIETLILNSIRTSDILINYAPNKYFLILHNADLLTAEKIWNKIQLQFTQKIYAGIALITNQSRQQLINEALNKLHHAINNSKDAKTSSITTLSNNNGVAQIGNFKMFRQEFEKKIENIISPVFYQIQQKYSTKLAGVTLQQGSGDGYGTFYIKGNHFIGGFRITSPGFSKINIDITFQKGNDDIDSKRISIEPEELEQGLLEDLLEQFIGEFITEGTDDE